MKPATRRARTGRPPSEDCRCSCGSLMARIADEGVELKCRRCKRTLLVPWRARDTWTPPRVARDARPTAEGAGHAG